MVGRPVRRRDLRGSLTDGSKNRVPNRVPDPANLTPANLRQLRLPKLIPAYPSTSGTTHNPLQRPHSAPTTAGSSHKPPGIYRKPASRRRRGARRSLGLVDHPSTIEMGADSRTPPATAARGALGQELADSAAGEASVTSVRIGSRRFGERSRHAVRQGAERSLVRIQSPR